LDAANPFGCSGTPSGLSPLSVSFPPAANGRPRLTWLAPTNPAVALMTERLRAGAAPAELTGSLARDPAAIRTEARAARAGALIERTDKPGIAPASQCLLTPTAEDALVRVACNVRPSANDW
jgi:hypothetical protein